MFIEQNKLIILAFVPRSGSNYLCDMLIRSGGLGIPLEYYFPYDFKERVEKWDAKRVVWRIDKRNASDEVSWFMQVLSRGGLKCTWTAHEKMLQEVEGLLDRIDIKYVYLRRRDKLRQAISWYLANVNGKWTSNMKKRHPDPPYDEKEIKKRLGYIELDETRWNDYLSNIDHLELFYEDLDYSSVLDQYEAFTGLRRQRTEDIPSTYAILRNKLTEEWVERYAESHT